MERYAVENRGGEGTISQSYTISSLCNIVVLFKYVIDIPFDCLTLVESVINENVFPTGD